MSIYPVPEGVGLETVRDGREPRICSSYRPWTNVIRSVTGLLGYDGERGCLRMACMRCQTLYSIPDVRLDRPNRVPIICAVVVGREVHALCPGCYAAEKERTVPNGDPQRG